MTRIVLDTNVLMSGIFWSGTPSKILEAWRNQLIELVYSPEVFDEYTRVADALLTKYPGVDVKPILALISRYGKCFQSATLETAVSRDIDDDKFIATAVSGNCPYIVTGDQDLLVLKQFNVARGILHLESR